MTREDLFRAIGEVEERRLARTENLSASNVTALEEGIMKQKTTKRRPLRLVLVAAVMVCLIAAVALVSAAPEVQNNRYALLENREPVLEAMLGQNGVEHYEGSVTQNPGEVNIMVENSYDRVPLDMDLAEKYLTPYLYAIGESQSDTFKIGVGEEAKSCTETLTVVANLYDASTGCGLLYYTFENPLGDLDYRLQYDGSIGGDDVWISLPKREFLDAANSTDTKLCVAVHYINTRNAKEVAVNLVGMDEIGVKLAQRELEHIHVADGTVTVSPIGMKLESAEALGLEHIDFVNDVRIRFSDGTEYAVMADVEGEGYDLQNWAYACGVDGKDGMTYTFNRIVDVDRITCVVINGTEYPV